MLEANAETLADEILRGLRVPPPYELGRLKPFYTEISSMGRFMNY